jgi:hypothetical protein
MLLAGKAATASAESSDVDALWTPPMSPSLGRGMSQSSSFEKASPNITYLSEILYLHYLSKWHIFNLDFYLARILETIRYKKPFL